MCHDDPFKDEQCMKKETLGSNDFVWVRKCKGAKVCVGLPYYGNIIGACSIKVRSHYDGESCANGNKCTSGICDGTKCKGLNPNIKCEVGLGQCKKGYLCRQTVDADDGSASGATTCQPALGENDLCAGFVNTYTPFNPTTNVCKLNLVCSAKIVYDSSGNPTTDSVVPKCVKIGSFEKGIGVSNPLACQSGVAEYSSGIYKCISPDGNTNSVSGASSYLDLTTSKGATFTNFANMSSMFTEWKREAEANKMKDEDANYAYRYTRNKKKINKLFFQYTYAPTVQDADECAFDFFWKQNSSNSLKFSLMILVLALLF